ncbi:MAG TPA: hypothetical protein VM598_00545, partial [Bdellovibrionota bacterium]|nr:hypothetical protein [Bdellovibrionota bacterium]
MAPLGLRYSSGRLTRLLFTTFVLCLATAPFDSFAEDIRGGSFARIVSKTRPPIRDLSFKSEYVPIEIRSKDKGPTPYAVLEGSFSRPDANLLFKQTKIRLSPTGEFRVSIPLTQKATPIQLVAVGVKGEVENQIIELDTDWASILKRVQDRKMPRFKFTPGINFSLIN